MAELDRDIIPGYLECLLLEASRYSGCRAKTLYIGGGTPSLLGDELIGRLVRGLKEQLSAAPGCEITLEANPGQLHELSDHLFTRLGITRLSIGLQRKDASSLELLGRRKDSFKLLLNSLERLRKTGVSISIDFIFGIPGDTVESALAELSAITGRIAPDHLSVYMLELKPGTPLSDRVNKGELTIPDDECVSEIYHTLRSWLSEIDFIHYEISNFCRPGHESRHNLAYFTNSEYIGLGAGAWQYLDRTRSMNSRDLAQYMNAMRRNEQVLDFSETGDLLTVFRETVMMGLRTLDGIPLSLENGLSEKNRLIFNKKLDSYRNSGMIVDEGERARIADDYLFVSNAIISDLIDLE